MSHRMEYLQGIRGILPHLALPAWDSGFDSQHRLCGWLAKSWRLLEQALCSHTNGLREDGRETVGQLTAGAGSSTPSPGISPDAWAWTDEVSKA